jgi:hypothetical protein
MVNSLLKSDPGNEQFQELKEKSEDRITKGGC